MFYVEEIPDTESISKTYRYCIKQNGQIVWYNGLLLVFHEKENAEEYLKILNEIYI